jgi:catechol 2,3-dioxygenase-like lactoylglutathione lyase family enzyme
MITHIRHTGLVVANLDLALHLWCDILGFRVAKRMEESGPHLDAMMGLDGVNVTTVKLGAPDGNLIELLHFHSHPDHPAWTGTPHSTGFTHVALTVTDLDDLCAKLATVGATFSAHPQYSPDGAVKLTYCRGPDGVLLELVEVLDDGE